MMRKIEFLLASALLLGACGGEQAEDGQTAEVEQETEEGLKDEAVKIEFVAANDDSVPAGTIVTAEGVASPITGTEIGDEFLLTTQEAEGEGTYVVSNNSKVEIKDGQKITVYGSYDGKTESGDPKITATIIE
jgi:major membrane immunogen (membrane-anchored lipoprotein)